MRLRRWLDAFETFQHGIFNRQPKRRHEKLTQIPPLEPLESRLVFSQDCLIPGVASDDDNLSDACTVVDTATANNLQILAESPAAPQQLSSSSKVSYAEASYRKARNEGLTITTSWEASISN